MPANTSKKKCPLRLHGNGQWSKKIRGKRFYFGTDKAAALAEYYRRANDLHLGSADPKRAVSVAVRTVTEVANEYLSHYEARAKAGEITYRQYADTRSYLKAFVQFIGPDRKCADVGTFNLQEWRTHLIEQGQAGNTINNRMAAVKAMYNWAYENDVLGQIPKLSAVKKITVKERERQVFTIDQVKTLLSLANTNMRAMIWLGLNCGLGCMDCSKLKWGNLDLEGGRLIYPRPKTGVRRNLKLWPETVAALQAVRTWRSTHGRATDKEDLVFQTKQGNPYVKLTRNSKDHDNAISKEFSKLLQKAKIEKEPGTGFYSLRRTVATLSAESGDVFAVQGILGHADLRMASRYVQRRQMTPQIDRVIEQTHGLIVGDSPVEAPGGPSPEADPAADVPAGDAQKAPDDRGA